jgi:hypothetical protein
MTRRMKPEPPPPLRELAPVLLFVALVLLGFLVLWNASY